MHCAEIIHSCSHPAVAAAAVRSIGSDFTSRIELLAGEQGLNMGAYAAHLVQQFAADADSEDWRNLAKAITRRDMPVLIGLRFIINTQIRGEQLPDLAARPARQREASAKMAACSHLAA